MLNGSTRDLGRAGESAVCDYMERQGYTVLCRNYTAGHCEIDVIAENERNLVFTEVKMRRDGAAYRKEYGRPSAAVNGAKKEHLLTAAKAYLKEHPTDKFPRMDVCEVWWSETEDGSVSFRFNYIERAFGAEKPKKESYPD